MGGRGSILLVSIEQHSGRTRLLFLLLAATATAAMKILLFFIWLKSSQAAEEKTLECQYLFEKKRKAKMMKRMLEKFLLFIYF